MTEVQQIRNRQKRILGFVRRLVWIGVLGGFAFFALKYDLVEIPVDYEELAPQHMRGGATVVAEKFDPALARVGNVVRYEPPEYDGKSCFGVIVGVAGDMVELVETRPGAGSLTVTPLAGGEARSEQLPLPTGHKLRSGVVPAGHVLVLNGDRAIVAEVGSPDSRKFGYIPVERVSQRLIIALNPFQ